MENFPLRYSAFGQVHPDLIVPSVTRGEILCPEPCRAKRIPFVLENYGRISPKPKSILPVPRKDSVLEVLDTILDKDEYNESDSDSSNQASFFCGSPPPRASNPVVNDAQFINQTRAVASPSGFYYDMKPPARIKRGSPTCGSSQDTNPKLTIEGFACRSPDSRGRRHLPDDLGNYLLPPVKIFDSPALGLRSPLHLYPSHSIHLASLYIPPSSCRY